MLSSNHTHTHTSQTAGASPTVNIIEHNMSVMTEINHQSYLLRFISTKPFQRQTPVKASVRVGTVSSLHLLLSGCKCSGRLIGERLFFFFTQCTKTWWRDARVNSEKVALTPICFLPLSFCLPTLSSLNHSIFIAEANQWQTSVYCLFCAQATALLQHPPLQKCFFPSVPLLITSRVTLNFLCPGRRDTSLNSHNYSSSPLTI